MQASQFKPNFVG